MVGESPKLVMSRKCSQQTKRKIPENWSRLPVCSGTHLPSNHQLMWLLLLQEQVRVDLTISHCSYPLSSCPRLFPLAGYQAAFTGAEAVWKNA